MIAMVFKLLGGIGLFLMGMVLLTDGLKAFAGEALRRALVRFTGTPAKAFTSGALVTALVQSSSATTVAVIGFVSAGLIGFPQAIGVVMGASLGTTGTGWIIAILGLKVSVGFYALPLVGLGAFMKLLGRGRASSLGVAIAGFGLIFIGIETLQEAMRGLSGVFNLATLPSGGLWGHLLAMGLGVLLTVIMQSSSAAVATTLTALHTGAINFEQAASLVIGAAVGTTVTGAIAAIGGNSPAKRTAMAHVLFNLFTGLIAVLLLPLLLALIHLAQKHLKLEPGAMSLAAFHTTFIALGVLIFLPLVQRFSRFIERVLPDRSPMLTRHLDQTVLQAPAVALEATHRALLDTALGTFHHLHQMLSGSRSQSTYAQSAELRQALEKIQEYFPQIPPVHDREPLSMQRLNQMHAMDHLSQLLAQLEPTAMVHRGLSNPRLASALEQARHLLTISRVGLMVAQPADWLSQVEASAMALKQFRSSHRPLILQETAHGQSSPAQALELLDALIWLETLGNHAWRLCVHLSSPEVPTPPEVPRE